MTLQTKIQFGNNDLGLYNKEFTVLNCEVHSFRMFDAYRPLSTARPEKIELTVVSKSDMDLSLQEWYISQEPQTGRLLFQISDMNSLETTERSIEFEDAVCFSMSERYDIDSNRGRLFTIQFVATKMKVDDVEFS